MKINLKRIGSFVLALVIALSALPGFVLTAKAAGTTLQTIDGLGATYTTPSKGKAEWSANGTTIVGKATGHNVKIIPISDKTTLTFTNNSGSKATLKFHYELENDDLENGGSLSGAISGPQGNYNAELDAGKSISITLTSPKGESNTNKLTISGLSLIRADAGNVTTTFKPAENGSFKVAAGSGSAQEVTEEISKTTAAGSEYTVTATANDGYIFFGWYNVEKNTVLSTDATYTFSASANMTISPKFVANTTAFFGVGALKFINLNEACAYAHAGTQKTVILLNSGTISGNYIIPDDVTLLIPFDEVGTLYTTTPIATRSTAAAKPFRTLTMAEGSSVTLASGASISVGGQYYAAQGGAQGKIVGPHGFIKMESGSAITVKSGASLYAWGFISGSGAVTVESGGSVYEWYQVLDFRGGSASSEMGNKVFPFNQYAVQNVEVPLTLHAGATETVYTAVYAMRQINPTSIPFIADDGMFKLRSGSLTKAYDGSTDRVIYTIDGTAEVNSLNLKLAGMSVSSSSYVLPLTNNMTINLTSGSKLTVNQTAALLPGVQASIAKGAELRVSEGKSIYIYDVDEWGSYCSGGGNEHFVPVVYAPGRTGERAPLADAKVDVNGTLTANGGVYTTASGADICSSEGTGQYVQQGKLGKEAKTYQYTQSGSDVTAHEIPITPAKLHNTNGTYTETKGSQAGDTYLVYDGIWALKKNNITITFNANGGTGEMAALMANPGYDKQLSSNTFTREGYTFTGWNTKADGTGANYADGATVKFDVDTTLYAQWTQKPVITFDANGGEGNMGAQTVNPGVSAALSANTFTRADYDFAGWNTKADGTGTAYADKTNITTNKNVTLYAQWKLHKYHVRWLNLNGAVLKEGYYTCEENAGYDMWFETDPEPTMPEDENYTYKFRNRWTPYDETKNGWGFYPHEDVDFTAEYNKFKKLTVTFDANGGIGTMDSVKIVNGESGEYYTLPECGFTREGYVFGGWLITGAVKRTEFGDKEYLNDELWTWPELLAISDLTLKASWKHADGWFTDDNGKQYYKNGELQKTGWTVIDGKTYYLDTETGYAATGIAALIPQGGNEKSRCVFDAEGVFQSNVTGVYSVGNDTYWLNSGVIEEEAGLKRVVKENGEVNYYYFVTSADKEANKDKDLDFTPSKAVKGNKVDFWITKTNGLSLPEWGYFFDENGVILHDEDTSKNGILKDGEDLYYYVDGIKAPAGMIKVGNDYYYVRSNGQLVVNRSYYCSNNHGLMADGTYTFDEEGRLKIEIPKNGIVSENDSLYYYKDGKLNYAGLIEINGSYYYVRTSGEVVHGRKYWITKTNGLMPEGSYEFDADGKMINPPKPTDPSEKKNGIVSENGSLYYYKDGKLNYAGLIEINGSYYYVRTSGEVVHGRKYWITKTNGLMPMGSYEFDADGKMINSPKPTDPSEKKDGIVSENGSLYYYKDGKLNYAGLIEIEGSYYYVRTNGEVVHGRKYWITKTNGLKAMGSYEFDDDGKMILG